MAGHRGRTEAEVPTWISCRYMIAYVGFIGFLLIYAMRFNFSIAIVCMVENNVTEQNDTSLTFEWDRELQGYLLSSFFYGYIITQIPGGFLADRYGGKLVFIGGMILSGIATILIPLAARAHYGLVILTRFLIGFGTGVVFPCIQSIWGKWAPFFERTKLIAFSISGSVLGSVSAFSISGVLCETLGWPSVFYLTGGACLLWCFLWWIFVYNKPEDHPRIKKVEIDYIEEYLSKEKTHSAISIPWMDIVKSLPVWAIIWAHASASWVGYTMFTCIPMYMNDVLDFDIKSSGLYSSIPYIISFITLNICSFIADVLRSRGMRTVVVRKGATVLFCVLTGSVMVAIGFLNADQWMAALILLILSAIGIGFTRSGYVVNHVDIAPRFAGLLYGISNTFATVTGILTPIVVGKLTPGRSRGEWQIVFIVCAVIILVGSVFYVVFAQGEEQEWAKATESKEVDIEEMDSLNNTRVSISQETD